MKSTKKVLGRLATISLLLFVTLIYACQTSTEPEPEPEPEPRIPVPVETVGDKEFTFTIIHRGTEEELTGYDIDIDGPVSASASGVSTAQFTLEDVVSGEYTITVSLDGFVDVTVTEELEVPEVVSVDYFAETTISLREMTPPVKVNNSEASTVKTGKPDAEDAEDDEEVTMQVPANTFPANVVNPDGTVDISVTRTKPSQITQSDDGLVRESIVLTPATTLNSPVAITVPIRVIPGLEDAEYVLLPGNIPLNQVGSGNLEASIQTGVSTDGPVAYQTFEAEIDRFQEYKVALVSSFVTSTKGFSASRNIGNGQCNAAIDFDYLVQGIASRLSSNTFTAEDIDAANRLMTFIDLTRYVSDKVVTINIPADDGILRASARNETRTYDISLSDESYSLTVNLPFVQTNEPQRVSCHDGGGS